MRLSTDAHIRELQLCARRSRREWMRAARVHARSFKFWGGDFVRDCMKNAVSMARRASRSSWQINKEPRQ